MASPEGSTRGRYTTLIVAVIATVIILLAVFLVLAAARARRTPPAQATAAPGPSASVRVIQPRGEAVDPPKEFSWVAVPGATHYQVRIADEDAVWPIFVQTTTEPRLLLDAREVNAITPGRIHEWDVEALDAKGQIIAKGGSRFRFMPPATAPAKPSGS